MRPTASRPRGVPVAALALSLAFGLAPAFAPGAIAAEASAPTAPRPPADVPDDAVFRALRAELERARTSLRLEGSPPPYFVSAAVSDVDSVHVEAVLGSPTRAGESHDRTLDVTVRVGDRTLDNTRFLRRDPFFRPPRTEPPEEDDERGLRRALWLVLDEAYKDAVEDLARKKAVLEGQMRSEEEKLPDFSDESATTTVAPLPPFAPRLREWEARAARLSAIFRAYAAIHEARVTLSATRRIVRYLDTEGRAALHPRQIWLLEATAETQADDGMPLADFVSFYAPTPDQAPGEEAMAAALEAMAGRLVARLSAPALDAAFSGPVLVEDQAAAELFLALAGQSAALSRDPVFEDARFSMAMDRLGATSPWKGRLGARVAADFLDVVDDPARREYAGTPLVGAYAVDDEGIPARAVTIVEKGVLRGVLATRTPVKGAERSNGHARSLLPGFLRSVAGGRPSPGVLVVTAANEPPLSPGDLRARLLETVRERGLEHGYVVRRIQNEAASPARRGPAAMFSMASGGPPSPVADPIDSVRISADGTETPVRGVRWGGIDARALKDLLAASSGEAGEAAFNLRASPPGAAAMGGFAGGGAPALPVSVVCPRAVLLEDAELAPLTGPFPAPPALPRPPLAAAPP